MEIVLLLQILVQKKNKSSISTKLFLIISSKYLLPEFLLSVCFKNFL